MNIVDFLQKFDDKQWVATVMNNDLPLAGTAKAMSKHCLENGWNNSDVYSITKIEIKDDKLFIYIKDNLQEVDEESEVITTMASKEALATDNIYLLEAYYMFFNKGTTFELNNGQVTGTYENGNE